MTLQSLSEKLVALLKERRALLCTVESCTGGRLAQLITQIPGASEVFWGSLVVYSNAFKEVLAGVPGELISAKGPVSQEVAVALAQGGIHRLTEALKSKGSHRPLVALSTTGVAGPGGGTPATPVGLCYVGHGHSGFARTLDGTAEAFFSETIQASAKLGRVQTIDFFATKALESTISNLTTLP